MDQKAGGRGGPVRNGPSLNAEAPGRCRSRAVHYPSRSTGDVSMPSGRGCQPLADGDTLFGREVRGAISADPEMRLHDAAVCVAVLRQQQVPDLARDGLAEQPPEVSWTCGSSAGPIQAAS